MTPSEIALFVVPAIAVGGVITQVAVSMGTVKQLKDDAAAMRTTIATIEKDASIANAHLAAIDANTHSMDQRIERLEKKVWNGTA